MNSEIGPYRFKPGIHDTPETTDSGDDERLYWEIRNHELQEEPIKQAKIPTPIKKNNRIKPIRALIRQKCRPKMKKMVRVFERPEGTRRYTG